jgi:hypothetical protein
MGHTAGAVPPLRKLRNPIPIPSAYETIIRDRSNRTQQKLYMCDLHLDIARERALTILTGVIAPAACCDECQREQAVALESAAARMAVRP